MDYLKPKQRKKTTKYKKTWVEPTGFLVERRCHRRKGGKCVKSFLLAVLGLCSLLLTSLSLKLSTSTTALQLGVENRIKEFTILEEKRQQQRQAQEKLRPPAPSLILCTHLSVNKIDLVKTIHDSWNGPMSVAVWITTKEEMQDFRRFVSAFPDKNVAFHTFEEPKGSNNQTHNLLYPHNRLRNLALKGVAESDYVLPVDGDFLPPKNSHRDILHLIQQQNGVRTMLHNKTLFILPAFKTVSKGTKVPTSRNELLKMYRNETIEEWHSKLGHGATNYKRWIHGKETNNDVSYQSLPPDPAFEPYFVAYRKGLPLLWEEFRGFGLNKVSWINELVLSGYKFHVLWDFFLVHLKHDREGSATKKQQWHRNRRIWTENYLPYLTNKYKPKEGQKKWLYWNLKAHS